MAPSDPFAALQPALDALAEALRARGLRLAAAESCTGGLIAAACTARPGSSDWFDRGFVSYSNAAKTELLGVPAGLIEAEGAVSAPVARAMAEGALQRSAADLALAVTGIAGPGGARPGKPVGTVWLAWAWRQAGAVRSEALHLQWPGDRAAVREATLREALARALAWALAQPRPPAPAAPAELPAAPAVRAASAEAPVALLAGRFTPEEQAVWAEALQAELAALQPPWRLVTDPACGPAQAIRLAFVANPPPGALDGLPALAAVQSLWAGVDRLLADPGLPAGLPLARMVDPAMGAAMAETALWAVLALQRGFFDYAAQQRAAQWRPLPQRRADETPVLLLGLGQMGAAVARALAPLGYRLLGWRRSAEAPRPAGLPPGLILQQGEAGLRAALAEAELVINLLPLTPATQGFFDADRLAQMRPGAALVHLGRGAQLVEPELLAALDTGRLRHAVLDVFATEPLPAGHPFWRHPRVTVLPHVAALTDPRSAARVAAANAQALAEGRPLAHTVDRRRGY